MALNLYNDQRNPQNLNQIYDNYRRKNRIQDPDVANAFRSGFELGITNSRRSGKRATQADIIRAFTDGFKTGYDITLRNGNLYQNAFAAGIRDGFNDVIRRQNSTNATARQQNGNNDIARRQNGTNYTDITQQQNIYDLGWDDEDPLAFWN